MQVRIRARMRIPKFVLIVAWHDNGPADAADGDEERETAVAAFRRPHYAYSSRMLSGTGTGTGTETGRHDGVRRC